MMYSGIIQDFVDCCQLNHLQFSAGKSKELVVDFFGCSYYSTLTPVNIQERDVEALTSYKPPSTSGRGGGKEDDS